MTAACMGRLEPSTPQHSGHTEPQIANDKTDLILLKPDSRIEGGLLG